MQNSFANYLFAANRISLMEHLYFKKFVVGRLQCDAVSGYD